MSLTPPSSPNTPRKLKPLWRAVIEVAFIVFLFYSNLLMGEFTRANSRGKSFLAGLRDVMTLENLAIALVTAFIGYAAFEYLRKKL